MTVTGWQGIDKQMPTRRDRHIIGDVGRAAGTLTAITAQLPGVLARINDATAGQPGASRTDTVRTAGHATVYDEHGIPMPAVSDPTGEAAIRPDPAAAAHLRIERLAADLLTKALALLDEMPPWQGRAPQAKELRETESVNTPGCESCARIDGHTPGVRWWNPPSHTVRIQAALAAKRTWNVCDWCKRQFLKDGRLPTEAELADHRDGKRRKRSA